MTSLGSAVQTAIRRGQTAGAYLGTVTAIDATAIALSIDIGTGAPLTGVRWILPYSPAVGDFVTVLRAGSAWVVLGKLSKDLTGPGFVEQTAYIAPSLWVLGGSWTDFPPPDNAWDWGGAYDQIQQGAVNEPEYGARTYASLCYYQSIAAQIPSGATITAAKVRFARIASIFDGSSGPALAGPVISGHTLATQPASGQTPTSILAAGYRDWRPGKIAVGQAASWALPSTWLSALLSGSLRGLAIYSERYDDYALFQAQLSGVLEITYRIPA